MNNKGSPRNLTNCYSLSNATGLCSSVSNVRLGFEDDFTLKIKNIFTQIKSLDSNEAILLSSLIRRSNSKFNIFAEKTQMFRLCAFNSVFSTMESRGEPTEAIKLL